MFFSIFVSMAIQHTDESKKSGSGTGGTGKSFDENMKKSTSDLMEKRKSSATGLKVVDSNTNDEPNPAIDRLRIELEGQP